MPPAWVAGYVGLPFKAHGRDRNGLDCWGLVRLVLLEVFSVDVPCFVTQYSSVKDFNEIERIIEKEKQSWISIPRGEERLGDVIVIRNEGKDSHVGLVLGNNEMLHTEIGIDSVPKNYLETDVKFRITGFYRHARIDPSRKDNSGSDPQ